MKDAQRTWSRKPRPVETSIFCTPGALSRVKVQEMLVSEVSRETVAVRTDMMTVLIGGVYGNQFTARTLGIEGELRY